jgi:hypothetical protein
MKVRDDEETLELAHRIEEEEALEWIAVLTKAREQIAELRRYAHHWDHEAFAQGNPSAIEPRRN